MFCNKKIRVGLAMLVSLMTLTACHTKVEPVSAMDREMSCSALSMEIQNVRDVKRQIESKRGFSGRNVGLALLFWPGVIVNEVSGSDAETQANARLSGLQNIYAEKKCTVSNADVAVNNKNEDKENKKG